MVIRLDLPPSRATRNGQFAGSESAIIDCVPTGISFDYSSKL